jgi:hypothetical protein
MHFAGATREKFDMTFLFGLHLEECTTPSTVPGLGETTIEFRISHFMLTRSTGSSSHGDANSYLLLLVLVGSGH